jgi:hypothetical protein
MHRYHLASETKVVFASASVCVCVTSHIVRERMYRFAPNLGAYSFETKKRFEEVKTPEKCLSSNPSEGGSSSTETDHDGRTQPRTWLFVSKEKSQEQRLQPRGSVPGSSLGQVANNRQH